MRALFDRVLGMSLAGSWVILLVLPARLALRKAPAKYRYFLWAMVLLRLLCPFSPESRLSVMPEQERITVNLYTPEELTALPSEAEPFEDTPPAKEAALPMLRRAALRTLRAAWPLGTAVMLAGGLLSLWRLRRRLDGAIPLRGNIRLADHIDTAFVLGVFRPRVYLPSSLSEKEQEYILLHEQTHLRRRDPLWKLLGFLALCVHWFNPLVWLALRCAERDMELSCDEAVLAKLGPEIRQAYASSLLRLSTGRSAGVAFGEGSTKARIVNVLRYKRPTLVLSLAAATAVILLACGLLTNPVNSTAAPFGTYYVSSIAYQSPAYSFTYSPETAPVYTLQQTDDAPFRLSCREGGQSSDCGIPKKVTLTKNDFAFVLPPEGLDPDELRREAACAWSCEQNGIRHLLMLRQDGQLWLARYQGSDDIRWLFVLSETRLDIPATPIEPQETSAPDTTYASYQEAYESLLAFRTADYRTQTAAAFRQQLARDNEQLNAQFDKYLLVSQSLTDGSDTDFIRVTLGASLEELGSEEFGQPYAYTFDIVEQRHPTSPESSEPILLLTETAAYQPYEISFLASCRITYSMTNAVTVGARDDVLTGFRDNLKRYAASLSDDEIVHGDLTLLLTEAAQGWLPGALPEGMEAFADVTVFRDWLGDNSSSADISEYVESDEKE